MLNVRDYENMVENLRIMSNDYLMGKLRRGMEQVEGAKRTLNAMPEEDDE